MLSRAFHGNKKTNKKFLKYQYGGEGTDSKNSTRSSKTRYQQQQRGEEDINEEVCIVGLMGHLPLINICNKLNNTHEEKEEEEEEGESGTHLTTKKKTTDVAVELDVRVVRPLRLCLRDVLMSSVQMMGESGLGISEKVVLLDGGVYAAKRFRKVVVSRKEFGRRVERLAHVSGGCVENLVQVRAYLYAKRIKLILSDYFPMGSLADLLHGARELGHTPLDWDQRFRIIIDVAKAVVYIHGRSPPQEKNLQINVHGNIKASNVLIKTDFSACLSDYGFVQLAETTEYPGTTTLQRNLSSPPEPSINNIPPEKILSQKNDIYSFGAMVLDMLGGSKAPFQISHIIERKEEIKEGNVEFFEFFVEGRNRKQQSCQVLDLALACTNRSPEARPSIDQILLFLVEVARSK